MFFSGDSYGAKACCAQQWEMGKNQAIQEVYKQGTVDG
jgi:hypothetical protein